MDLFPLDYLPLDVLRIILGMTSPDTVKNFSMTSKRNLRFQLDKQIWTEFCIKRTLFTREVFSDLVEGKEETIRRTYASSLTYTYRCKYFCKYPYNDSGDPKQLVVGGNSPMCVYFIMRRRRKCIDLGHKTLTIPGLPYCHSCFMRLKSLHIVST